MEKIKEMIGVRITGETTSNFDNSNDHNKSTSHKFISFSLVIDQDVLSDLQLQF